MVTFSRNTARRRRSVPHDGAGRGPSRLRPWYDAQIETGVTQVMELAADEVADLVEQFWSLGARASISGSVGW